LRFPAKDLFWATQAESGPHRTGSHRHDLGGAADFDLYDAKDGHKLDMRNPEDALRFLGLTHSLTVCPCNSSVPEIPAKPTLRLARINPC
jgi:hypothetical protein